MKSDIKSLKQLKPLEKLKGLSIPTNREKYLDEIEILTYSSNLCLYGARIIRNEIKINNRDKVLSLVTNEISKLYNLLSKDSFLLDSTYTKKNIKIFTKEIGMKPKHIKV